MTIDSEWYVTRLSTQHMSIIFPAWNYIMIQIHSGRPLACVAWRFCRAGRRSGVAAKFAREAREKNKNPRSNLLAVSLPSPAFIT